MQTINTKEFTTEQETAFIKGWEASGGYIGDADSPTPWCCPWFYQEEIQVEGDTPEEWGASWWNECRAEVEAELEAETEEDE